MSKLLIEMAKDLTMSLIESRQISTEEIVPCINTTFYCLKELQAIENNTVQPVMTANDPVAWKKSIRHNTITCLECGVSYRNLSGKHLRTHDLDGKAYRKKYNIPADQALSSRASTERRREVVNAIRPWERAPAHIKSQAAKAAAKGATAKASSKRLKAS